MFTPKHLRLPQDVGPPSAADRRGIPDVNSLTNSVEFYAALHADALRRHAFQDRALACWGLIARGDEALPWIEASIVSPDDDHASDAAGILMWIGVPQNWVAKLRALSEGWADSERLDALLQALPPAPDEAQSQPPVGTDVLYNGQLDAFTKTIWFIDRPIRDVMRGIREGHSPRLKMREYPLHGELQELLRRLEPWSRPSRKALVVETKGEWTALFSQGSDIYLFDVAARYLHCRSLYTSYSPMVRKSGEIIRYGNCAFWLNDETTPGREARCIQASYQSRWTWNLQGEALPFEETQRYADKKIVRRFDIAMLNRYCQALGIRRNDAHFFGPDSILIERDTSPWRSGVNKIMTAAKWLTRYS